MTSCMVLAGWTDACATRELTDGRAFRIDVDGSGVLLLKSTGQLYAIGNQCSHQGAALDRGVVRVAGSVRTVTCPAHGSMFNLETGKVMRPPATKPVPVYDVKIEEGRVYVRPRADT